MAPEPKAHTRADSESNRAWMKALEQEVQALLHDEQQEHKVVTVLDRGWIGDSLGG